MTDSLDQVLDRVPALRRRTSVEDLAGGLTNRNLKVTTPDEVYVVRMSSSDASLLGIDRDAEHLNTAAAAQAGVGAEVVDYRPDLGLLVITFLPGIALDNESFTDAGVMARSAAACRSLHAGPAFAGVFDMFTRQAGYLATVLDNGFPLPPDYERFTDAFADVRRALARSPRPLVPCNNDLLAGNYLDNGERVWLIDYEYSGMNDACFELGNTATECEFTPEMTEAWTEAYFGELRPSDLARVRLQSLCSEYGWSLWGFIQAASSPIDYDFHAWGMHRFEKAARTFTSTDFTRLLEEVNDRG
ncbi:MAG: phosphotransferase [Nocardioidaceae bacterium]